MTDQTIVLAVEGMFQGVAFSQAHTQLVVKKDYEIQTDLWLDSGVQAICGSCNGCCSGLACITNYSFDSCGGEQICARCDSITADNCDTGYCRCGAKPACSKANGADKCVSGECRCGLSPGCGPGYECVNGQCRCGESSACAAGQECVNAQCVCTRASCPQGCCSGSVCVFKQDQSDSRCGVSGSPCESCNQHQTCSDGVCSDCAVSCLDGCCSGNRCLSRSPSSCGMNGTACMECDPIAGDSCNAQGQCACGEGFECAPGQQCNAGVCQCTSTSCPNGCCSGNQCMPQSTAACGVAGGTCVDCGQAADRCTNGKCKCGNGDPCTKPGQTCTNGECR
jgi:hypothetical protein